MLLTKLHHCRTVLGLPNDFRVREFTDNFRVVVELDGLDVLELAHWDLALAVNALERDFVGDECRVRRTSPHDFSLPRGHARRRPPHPCWASDMCKREKQDTLTSDDLLWAMDRIRFEDHIELLDAYLDKYIEGGSWCRNLTWCAERKKPPKAAEPSDSAAPSDARRRHDPTAPMPYAPPPPAHGGY